MHRSMTFPPQHRGGQPMRGGLESRRIEHTERACSGGGQKSQSWQGDSGGLKPRDRQNHQQSRPERGAQAHAGKRRKNHRLKAETSRKRQRHPFRALRGVVDDFTKKPPLLLALHAENIPIIKPLLENGAEITDSVREYVDGRSDNEEILELFGM